jgi:putative ABC transport system ATP-binding protein
MARQHRETQIALRIFSLMRGEGKDVFVVLTYALGVGICSLATPIGVQALVNSVTFGAVIQPLVVLTALVGGVLLFSGILRVLQLWVVELLQRRFVVRFSLMLAQRLPHVSSTNFQQKYGPEYVLRFMEVFSAQKVLAALLLDGVALFFQVATGMILVAFYHPFFLAFAMILFFCVVLITLPLGFGAIRTAIATSDAKYNVMTWLQDLARLPVLFKSARGDAFAVERADDLVNSYLMLRARHFRILLRQVIGSVILQVVASTLLLGLGGWLVMKGELTLGQLVAAELVLGLVLSGIAKFGRYLDKFYDLCASTAKLDSLLDLPYEHLSGSFFSPGREPAYLRISDLTLHFKTRTHPTLSGCSLELKRGESTAIWGENGSGKSSLADCIYRLVDFTSGGIEVDEHDVKDIHPLELRSEVALVRTADIFHGTIEENLTLGDPNISAIQIREALKLVGAYDEIRLLPEGLRTMLKGNWGPISRGQVLQLMIARAVLTRPRLLIIDGALDGVDEGSLATVMSSLLRTDSPWTLLVLTHEKEILRYFQTAHQLKDGSLSPIHSPSSPSTTPGGRA